MSTVPTAPTPDEHPFVASLDPGNRGPGGPLQDTRPSYSPAALVADVMILLRHLGVTINADASPHVAAIAAADLLRALGVRPVAVPDAPPKNAPVESARCPRCGGMPLNGKVEHLDHCPLATPTANA